MADADHGVALEEQIDRWRSYLRRRQAVHSTDLEELERRLREQIGVLTEAGLSPDEAFLVAVKRLGDLLKRDVVTVPADTSIRKAARLMSQENVSSVLVMKNGQLAGIVTDRDMRQRVLAVGVEPTAPIDEIMIEMGKELGFTHVKTFYRDIPNKRMPKRNSPKNITGEKKIIKNTVIVIRKVLSIF